MASSGLLWLSTTVLQRQATAAVQCPSLVSRYATLAASVAAALNYSDFTSLADLTEELDDLDAECTNARAAAPTVTAPTLYIAAPGSPAANAPAVVASGGSFLPLAVGAALLWLLLK